MPSAHAGDIIDARRRWMALRRSNATVQFYGYASRTLLDFIAAHHAEGDLSRWTPALADDYAQWLAAKRLSPTTVRHYLDALVTLCAWASKKHCLAANPLADYEPPRSSPAVVTGYRQDELRRMLNACEATRKGRRNHALLLTLWDSGLRASELCALTLRDLDLDQQTLLVERGKGEQTRTVAIGEGTVDALRHYLRRVHPDPEDGSLPLFPGRGRAPLTRFGLYQIVSDLAKAAGVTNARLGVHRVRHSMAVHSLANGASLRFVQLQLGHAQLATTQKYLAFSQEDMRRQRNQTSPVPKRHRGDGPP